jgi:peptidoglycan/xylan/chitin deacetylase (PgdA/CDA1 family)
VRAPLTLLVIVAAAATAVLVVSDRQSPPVPAAVTQPAATVRRAPRPRPRRPALLRLPTTLPRRRLDLPILMYHRIDLVKPTLPEITQRLTVNPRVFAAQMHWLVRAGFHSVTPLQAFEALEYGQPLPRHPVLITFDDGYRDVLGKAAPTLHRLHLHAIEFVITDRVDGPDPSFLTWPELRRLERLGVAIGSHTVTHRNLVHLTAPEVRVELRRSRAVLERHLGHPVQWFAYPSGGVDRVVAAQVRQAGYVLAVTTMPGTVQSARQPLLLHRDEILDTTGVAGFAALLGD